jgi:hypothetical protein
MKNLSEAPVKKERISRKMLPPGRRQSFEAAALPAGRDSEVCALVRGLFAESA